MCSSGGTQRLVLVVEDNPQIQELVLMVLADEQIPAAQARTASEAVTSLTEQRPAVMLLDIGLPDATTTPITAVVATARHNGTSVIICSAAGRSREDLSRAVEADAYIVKPFDIDELAGTIRGILDKSEPQV
jgi:DNA-binding response OmpR family regulator